MSSVVRFRAFVWHKTVLPPSRGSIRCIIAESTENAIFLENRKQKYDGNMRNRLFVPDFLFDFYTNRGSIGIPSALSNVSRADFQNFAQNGQSAIFAFFNVWSPFTEKVEKREKQFSAVLVEGLLLYWYLSKHLLCSTYFADRWRWNFVDRKTTRKHVKGGKDWALLPPASNIVAPSKLKPCPWCTNSKKLSFPLRDAFSSWEIARWIV